VNGTPITGNAAAMKRLMSKIAYVKQADIFFMHLSVRDQLGYTAFLRLPQAWSKNEKLEEVERIISLLRLNKVSESPIYMLSGGEKKRVNIGTELLTDPSCLLLDEPTSGLDSTSAVALMKMLQNLAKTQKKTIITSIHQPNSALFQSFDKVIMLAEGYVVYFGNPVNSLNYLEDQQLTCPNGYNAADHWMDLLVRDSAIDEEKEQSAGNISSTEHTTAYRMTTRQQLIDAWDGEAVAEQMDMTLKKDSDEESEIVQSFQKYNTSWGAQYRILVHRALKNSRSAIFTPINLIKSAAIGLIAGLLWFQLDYTEESVFDRSSYFFFTMTFWVFDSMFGALMAFPSEREVILKERSSGSYHLSAYFLAKTTSEMPVRLVLPFIYMAISFWMAAISPRFDLFVLTTLISLLSVVAGEALGLLVGATIYDMEKAMSVMTVASLALMLLGGFFVENIPSFLSWGKYLSPFKYSFDASRQLVFDRPVPCDGSGALEDLCAGLSTGSVPSEDVIEFLNIQGSVGFNVGLLVVIGLVPRYVAYLALKSKKESER
jgi:ABC-type multidrug transport system ATPase subunit